MSLDGFLADQDDNLDFLTPFQATGEDYGYTAFTKNVDTYIVGKKTYDVVMGLTGGEFPQKDQYDCYIITRQEIEGEKNLTFYNRDISTLINTLKSKEGKDIYCDGGGQIVQLLMEQQLIDEYIIHIVPTILGEGKRLFKGNVPPQDIMLVESKSYSSGMVLVHYQKKT